MNLEGIIVLNVETNSINMMSPLGVQMAQGSMSEVCDGIISLERLRRYANCKGSRVSGNEEVIKSLTSLSKHNQG